jgi:4-aminobutyrate aminotransferase/(S)-3-amino-2-methylpropionate transaminase
MITGGYYYRDAMTVKEPYRIYNTWMGDPSKLLLAEAMINVVKEDNLLEKASKTGAQLLDGLKNIQVERTGSLVRLQSATQDSNANKVHSARGVGLYASLDATSVAVRDKIVNEALKHGERINELVIQTTFSTGLHMGGCGDLTIRFRPALIFNKHHCEILLDRLNKTIKSIAAP